MSLSIDRGPAQPSLIESTIGAQLEATVERFPDREALVIPHQAVRQTWAELDAVVNATAKGLIGLGIEPGDRVGMWSPNYAEWVYMQFATAKIGAIQVNVNPAYRSSELQYVLAQSDTRLLVTRTAYRTSAYREMIHAAKLELPGLERVIYFDTNDWAELLTVGQTVTDVELRSRCESLSPNDPINIQYTSGTTGFPKGATLSHRNILNNAQFTGDACRFTEEDRLAIPVPFYHCFGMVMGNLACSVFGHTMVVPCATFDPGAVLQAVQEERCTALYGVPTMFIAELGHPDFERFDLSSLRTGIMAGSPCPIEVMRRVVDQMGMDQVTIAYGMTETSPVSTQTSADDPLERRVSTVGRVHPHVEIKIVDPRSGETVERRVGGELCARGYSVMLGYWNDAEKTKQVIDSEGWMHTGDLATMDEEGFVNIIGRIKDMIIRGGENIYPREIEEFLLTHPAVAQAQVIGVPDPKFGEELMAWVKLHADQSMSQAELKTFCRGKIAHFKVPRYVKFVSEFPLTVTGKVRKVEMRKRSIEELGLDALTKSENA